MSVCCSYLNMVFPDIGNLKYPHGRTDQQQQKSNRQRLRFISQNDRLPLLSLFACFHCTGSCEKFSFLPYDSWSALPWKHEPRQNTIRTFLKTPAVLSGFSLLSLERSSLAVYAGVQDVDHLVFHVSIKWEAALLVHHFFFRQRLMESAFRLFFVNVI